MSDLRFTATHEWLRQDGDEVTIGITEHAQELLGDMVYVELPREGEAFEAGATLGVVESVKAASDFYAPVSGVVTGVNHAVNDNPALVNTEPFGAGWLVRLKPQDSGEMEALMNADQYQKTLEQDA